MADATNSAAAAADLDQLLDSALDDFTNLNLTTTTTASSSSSSSGSGGADPKPSDPRPTTVQGLGMGLPDPKSRRRPARPREADPAARGSSASEALERLTRETHEAVRGIASATSAPAGAAGAGFGDGEWDEDAMVEEFMKHFGGADELLKHFGDASGMGSEEELMDSMMQMLLSKGLLHEPMKEIAEKYPKWLDEHKGNLSKEEFEQHRHQYELITKLNDVYENDPENFPKVMEILQEMQKCTLPPDEIVREIIPDFDLSTLGQLQPGQSPNCSIM